MPDESGKNGVQNRPIKEDRLLQIPLIENEIAILQIPFPMTIPQWEHLMDVLAAMKPGIVRRFEVWDTESANRMGVYRTRDEAIALIEAHLQANPDAPRPVIRTVA